MAARTPIVLASSWLALEEAGAREPDAEEKACAEKGTHELGGDVALGWTQKAFRLEAGPSVGVFSTSSLKAQAS